MYPGARVVIAAGLATLVAVGSISSAFLDLAASVETARRWAASLGPLAPGVYGGLAVIATLVGVPAAPIAVLAALLFGPYRAAAVIVSASIASAALGFWLARRTVRRIPGAPQRGAHAAARLTRLVETHEPAAIFLLRMIPVVPFALINYALGLTGIRFSRYLFWSVVAIVPADAAVVFWADGFYGALANRRIGWVLASIAVAAACALAGLLVARRAADGLDPELRSSHDAFDPAGAR